MTKILTSPISLLFFVVSIFSFVEAGINVAQNGTTTFAFGAFFLTGLFSFVMSRVTTKE